MNSKDRIGLFGGGRIRPCGGDRNCDSRSNRTHTIRAVASNESGSIAISRPKSLRSSYSNMRFAKLVSMLVICAAATILVSAIAHASVDAARVAAPAPGPPFMLEGLTLDPVGTPYSCLVTVTNLRTGETNTTVSDALDGYYRIDLQNQFDSGYLVGDLINATAINDTALLIGWNQLPAGGGGSMWMDITLDGVYNPIPEFPMLIVPVMGVLALFAVVRLRRKGEEQ